jgi:hypothetical protein
MSLFDCIQRAMDDPEIKADKARGERAQAMWRELSDRYARDGHPRHAAEQLAGDDVKEAFRREAGERRHVYLAQASFQRKAQAHVMNTAVPDMTRRMEKAHFARTALVRRFNGRLGEYLKRHAPRKRDLVKGKPRDLAEQMEIADELAGVASGNPIAKLLADGIRDALEDLRLMFNEAGGLISKLENWDVPHMHDELALKRAGFDEWFKKIDGQLAWERIVDPLTGRPMMVDGRTGRPSDASRRSFLRSAYDNIVFGRDTENVVYGKPQGVATYRKHQDQRHLHFKSGRDWMEYNRDFGTGGLHQTLMGHVHRMARDITLMREFGPNPKLGAQYEADLWRAKAKKSQDEPLLAGITSDSAQAMRMMNVQSGGAAPTEGWMQWVATTGSTTRHVLSSAHLDRAIIASISDLNTMRVAANAMGMSGRNLIAKQIGLLPSLSREQLLRAGWVGDTQADGGTALARFQQEVAPREFAERLSNLAMRVQGLAAWTDRARAISYQEFSGAMDDFVGRPLADMPLALRNHFQKWGVTEKDWAEFSRPENRFVADNGATFLMPIYWRNTTDMRPDLADRLFFKIQGATEEWMNEAVVTASPLMQGWTDPSAINLPPGHPIYEIVKSGTMYKSFPLTFTINQIRRGLAVFNEAGGGWKGAGAASGYAINVVAGATVLGAVSLQIGDIGLGRDPQDMTTPEFWARATLKGGGFAVLGDLIASGQSVYGGDFKDWLIGPFVPAIQDAWGLTGGAAMTAIWQAANGEDIDLKYAKSLTDAMRRYTPMGQTPLIGPAYERLIIDRLLMLLDPEAMENVAKAAKKRDKDVGGGSYWMPGSPLPGRMPNFGNAIGQ